MYCSFALDSFVSQGGKADRHALEASLKEKFCVSPRFMEAIIMLLSKFELAIPLDKTTFLIPSLLQNEEVPEILTQVFNSFSRSRAFTLDPNYNHQSENSLSLSTSIISKRRSGTGYLTTVAHTSVPKQITLIPTGKCFHRVFVADHIPANFWPRLIARFLSSARSFHAIICDNCSPGIQCENLVQVGDATIGALKCGWSYAKNYISLCLGQDILLCVNGLHRKGKSASSSKVETVRVYNEDVDFKSLDVHDGFEVIIPDYKVRSHATLDSNAAHESCFMSAQILSHVLETTDEVFRDWFDGLSDRGIYSDKYLTHFVPCPFCYDGKKSDLHNANRATTIQPKRGKNPVGFSVRYCLLQARTTDCITCPNCGELSLKDLAPDLVSFKTL